MIVTDCKSSVLMLEQCHVRWTPTALQLAAPLTKNMDSSLPRTALEQGSFQLLDEDASLQTNAHRKQALRESHHRILRECEFHYMRALM